MAYPYIKELISSVRAVTDAWIKGDLVTDWRFSSEQRAQDAIDSLRQELDDYDAYVATTLISPPVSVLEPLSSFEEARPGIEDVD